jgi:RimJ/RimL family protein N-acetyltransferase
MRLLFGCADLMAAWVKARIAFMDPEGFGPCQAVGVVDGQGRIVGGVVFHGWNKHYRSIEMSAAADSAKWLSRRIVAGILSYPFEQLGCERVTSVTRPEDGRTRHLLEGIGMTLEGIGRKAFGDHDAAGYALLRDEWRAGRFGPAKPEGKVSHG